MTIEDFKRYEFAILAGKLFHSKDESQRELVPGALYALGARIQGVGGDVSGYIEGSRKSRIGIETAIGTYAKKYKELGEDDSTFSNFYDYAREGADYLENHVSVAPVLEQYGGENLTQIRNRIALINYHTQSPDENERNEAEEQLRQYTGIITLLQVLEDNRYARMLPEIVQRQNIIRLDELQQLAEAA